MASKLYTDQFDPLSDAPPPSKPSWRKSITPEMRAKLLELHKLSTWTWAKIPFFIALWFALGALAIKVDSLFVRIPCWIVIGFILHGLGVFMHEGAHGALLRKGMVDRVIGFLCGLPVFFPCASYRATHLLHHQHENTPQDPDNLEANFPNRYLRSLLYYAWFSGGMVVYIVLVTFTGPFRAKGVKETLHCIIEPLLIAAFMVGLFTAASRYDLWPVLLNGWIWALPFTVLIANVRGLAEHTQLFHSAPPDPLHSTRSLRSNKLISFFFNNQNHHLEHHLFPGVPWNNLGKVHDLMEPVYETQEASVTRGYVQWISDALRYGPNRTLSYKETDSTLDPPRESKPPVERLA